MNTLLDFYLEKIKQRYIPESESSFRFSLLKSKNFFYLYLFSDKDSLHYEFRPMEMNKNPLFIKRSIEDRLVIRKNIEINCVLEGIIDSDLFYISDVLVWEGQELNEPFKKRYFYIKKILTEFFELNKVFATIRFYEKINLEYLIQDIIPNVNFIPEYILMVKNLESYIISLKDFSETSKINKKHSGLKYTILLNLKDIENIEFQKQFEVKKTSKPEIYVIEIKPNIYCVLRIPGLYESKKMQKEFENKNKVNITCKYNSRFKKYEPIFE